MGPCCLSGALATGTPTGIEGEIAGLPTYISKPSSHSLAKTIIFLPDGITSARCIYPEPKVEC